MSDYDFDIWYKTKDPIFSDISKKSRLPEKWISYNNVLSSIYKDSIIKPINKYVENLYPYPTLIKIENNVVRLRQHNHAEIFLLNKNHEFYNLDRPWMRQYYNTDEKHEIPNDCFPGTYKFYAPWFIDANIRIDYEIPKCESPFYIYESQVFNLKSINDLKYREPDFITFHFKSAGSHMVNDNFGKIKRNSPMFDMVFEADDIIVERVRNFYEKN